MVKGIVFLVQEPASLQPAGLVYRPFQYKGLRSQ
jgi:hypothetical protein